MDYSIEFDKMMDGGEEDENLRSAKGVRYLETVVSQITKYTPTRHFAVPSHYGNESEPNVGPLALFSFIVPSKTELKISYNELHHALTTALKSRLHNGLVLDTLEKGVLYPVVHFSDDRESLKKCLSGEHNIGEDFVLQQGVFREVRSIRPEGYEKKNGEVIDTENVGYILLGFKSLDKNFNQVMVDSWKDWTGARHIYMYLPDDLGLAKISFYHREAPDSLNMFMYLVLVECHNVSNKDKQIRLLDFAQRMRVERMSGYISVYAQSPINK